MSVITPTEYKKVEKPLLKRSTAPTSLWQKIALGIILLVAGVLNFWGLDQMGYSNTYYAAAVKSMLQSWHNFFFVSLDAGGFVSIDKPPLALWIQTASAKLFGFSGVSIILPEAIAGLLSVAVLYYLVRRVFGPGAGLVAALALTVMPVSVVVSRNNLVDSILVLVLLLGAWAISRAVETGRLRWLLLCAVIVGLGFNVKMMQAYLILPAFGLVYLFGTSVSWRRRILNLFLAALLLIVVSLSWIVAVDLVPASQRPYVGSSTTNSELELAIGYNGLERLLGMNGGGGTASSSGGFGGRSASSGTGTSTPPTGGTGTFTPPTGGTGTPPTGGTGTFTPPTGGGTGAGGGGTGGFFNTGQAGVLRLFSQGLGGQSGWLLPLALIGLIVAASQEKVRLPLTRKQQGVVLWGTWLLTTGVFFSVAGFFHQYYLATMAPAVAAMAGIGIMALWKEYRRGSWSSWLLPVALVVTAGVQIYMLSSYQSWSAVLTPIIAGLCILGALGLMLPLIIPRLRIAALQKTAVVIGMIALLAAPSIWSAVTVLQANGGLVPSAGPSTGSVASLAPASSGSSQSSLGVDQQLVKYLEAHKGNATYLFATMSATSAAPYIISTGDAVMALGGFTGSDNILTTSQLATLVKEGKVHYFLLSGNGGGQSSGNSALVQWIESHSKVVPSSQWQGSSTSTSTGGNGGGTLYEYSG
jgi:4-amino-4-deoxy-L-arabinose transferase-like glycosyltransferase